MSEARDGRHVTPEPLVAEWMERAACLGKAWGDHDPWFPEFYQRGKRNHAEHLTAAALNLCWTGCPVQVECLSHALSQPERDGIWGGTFPRHRRSGDMQVAMDLGWRALTGSGIRMVSEPQMPSEGPDEIQERSLGAVSTG